MRRQPSPKEKVKGLLVFGAFALAFFIFLASFFTSIDVAEECRNKYEGEPAEYCRCVYEFSPPPWRYFYSQCSGDKS